MLQLNSVPPRCLYCVRVVLTDFSETRVNFLPFSVLLCVTLLIKKPLLRKVFSELLVASLRDGRELHCGSLDLFLYYF